jgi:hypothetical protein
MIAGQCLATGKVLRPKQGVANERNMEKEKEHPAHAPGQSNQNPRLQTGVLSSSSGAFNLPNTPHTFVHRFLRNHNIRMTPPK